MRKTKKKLPNAQKHGAFANTAILPGEDRHEFEKLHSDLIEEWTPVGPTEEDAVLSIANGIWHKRRVQRFLLAEIQKAKFDPKNQAYDLADHLVNFAGVVANDPDNAFRVYSHLLPAETVAHFKAKCQRECYESSSQWAEALGHLEQ